ncbi:MAG: F0F1 ATP synthase subunit A [Campylobacteraceae bacterium]|jgi:F-type H+-transporting ATPase subunit a|nr:F0F1 ATP synthase subunit A [Campylobacteraceae bacterium]
MSTETFVFTSLFLNDHILVMLSQLLIVAVIILIVAKLATSSLQLVPGGVQNVMEAFLEGIISIASDVAGEEVARKYLPLAATIAIFIFVSNMIGVIPGFEAPTSNINITLTLAVMVFLYYNFEGIRKNGVFKYFKHFMGPKLILAPLMFPIEVISHFSRIISLSFRLFGNVRGDDLFLAVVLFLAPWVLPILPFFILVFFGALQAFIFMILTYVYIAGAVHISEEH